SEPPARPAGGGDGAARKTALDRGLWGCGDDPRAGHPVDPDGGAMSGTAGTSTGCKGYPMQGDSGLECKFAGFGTGLNVSDGAVIEGHGSLFGVPGQGGDVVKRGAYGASLAALAAQGRKVRMLWQHDPLQPIGVWDEVREDGRGLWVRGRILDATQAGR